MRLTFLTVPVYDAHSIDTNFEWSANVFKNLGDHFQFWDGEVPLNSFAVVGYCVQIFKANDKLPAEYRRKPDVSEDMWKVRFLVQFILVLATPPGWMDPVWGWVEGNDNEGN